MTSKIKILFSILLFPFFAQAVAPKPKVIYFAGFHAGEEQASCWKRGAQFNPASAGYSFDSYPFPEEASTDRDKTIAGGKDLIAKVIAEIQAEPNRTFVLVGHSAGSALAIEAAEQLTKKVKKSDRLQLVTLDGFPPSLAIQKKVKTTCMYAVNKAEQIESNNAQTMRKACGQNAKAYEDNHCKREECLHYVLANTKVLPQFHDVGDAITGYTGCGTNLAVLLPPAGIAPKTFATPTKKKKH